MRHRVRHTVLIATLFASLVRPLCAQDVVSTKPVPTTDQALDELRNLIGQVRAKIGRGTTTAADLAPEIAEFDRFIGLYADKPETAASFALMKASLYLEVLKEPAKGRELLLAVKANYPGTEVAQAVDAMLAQFDRAAKAEAARATLVGHPAPDLHFQWASRPELKTLSGLKGQVVVLDFWATWCGPCLASFPQMRDHVAHFRGAPVTFIGVTSLQGRVSNLEAQPIDTEGHPEKETALLPRFMTAKNMTWDVAVSAEPVFNPAYGIEGIPFVAIIAPDGTVRHAGLHPGDPAADIAGKVEALLKEFNLPLPKS